jgi:hypothetical protein
LQVDLQLGMRGHEARQARHQPARREGGHHRQPEHVTAPCAERAQRLLDRVEVWRDLFEEAAPVGGEFDAARVADEQALAQPLLKSADLVAERADGEVQRFRRARQVAVAGGGDKTGQSVQGRPAHGVDLGCVP